MAPKTPLLTAGTTNHTPYKTPVRRGGPITTKEKIQAAAAKRDKALKNIPREAPSSTSTKEPEPRSLPPPAETDVLARARNAGVKKTAKKPYKPMTTQRKIAAETLKAQAKGPQTKIAVGKADEEKEKIDGMATAKAAKKKPVKAKAPGMMAVLRSHDSSTLRFEKQGAHRAVMSRRTVRSTRLLEKIREQALKDPEVRSLWECQGVQRLLEEVKGARCKITAALKHLKVNDGLRDAVARLVNARVLPAPGKLEILAVDLDPNARFRFLDLPSKIRKTIYSMVVVDSAHFVDPELPSGQEQPDLAMVCKQIRHEVLPIFYMENIFTIDLTTRPVKKNGSTSLILLMRWARQLEAGGWFKIIRHWVFAHTPFTQAGEADEDVMLSVKFNGSGGCSVELHSEASCVLAGKEGRLDCAICKTPDWVNGAVIEVCDGASTGFGSVSGEMVLGLATEVKDRMGELVGLRCGKGGVSA